MVKVGDIEIWVKPLGKKGKEKAITIMNRGEEEKVFTLSAAALGIYKKSELRDLWLHQDIGKIGNGKTFTIPKHGIVVLKIY
jgi:hypothetical protein